MQTAPEGMLDVGQEYIAPDPAAGARCAPLLGWVLADRQSDLRSEGPIVLRPGAGLRGWLVYGGKHAVSFPAGDVHATLRVDAPGAGDHSQYR
jgi:hypothetical protein